MEQEHVMLATAGTFDIDHEPDGTRNNPNGHLNDPDHRRLLKQAVAALPHAAIGDMQRRELVFAIRTAELPWLNGAARQLDFADRPTLERLAFLARRVCRRQLIGLQWRERPR